MGITSRTENQGRTIFINVTERFDFNQHAVFRKLLNDAKDGCEFVVDLTAAEYMDSSALGLLLLLRKKAGNNRVELRYVKPSAIEKVVSASNFSRLFDCKAVSPL
ncbi:STAS domain-containing protein [Marinospirillum alkaliphilum]|uniref:Anti-anti-sigma factor n=1 Tax=Marinospirillum alkaliphilum DSM 21637 TaxID=1122209 RepID=A0A1K1X244_9GAMM|nr:STAS domain-containing protein [Marinospirillum alkaliphilum]SFX43252.1 anti-anti-sigma factor [Marinospirillum alkaliphilum DSM 21637]